MTIEIKQNHHEMDPKVWYLNCSSWDKFVKATESKLCHAVSGTVQIYDTCSALRWKWQSGLHTLHIPCTLFFRFHTQLISGCAWYCARRMVQQLFQTTSTNISKWTYFFWWFSSPWSWTGWWCENDSATEKPVASIIKEKWPSSFDIKIREASVSN